MLRTCAGTDGAAFKIEAILPPELSGPPPHRHRRHAETFTVLEGELRVRLGRERRVLAEGESVTVPPGVVHAFANPTDRPVRIRTVEAPAGPLEAQLRTLADSGRFPPLRRLARINVDHDYDYVQHGIPERLQRTLWWLLARGTPPSTHR